MPNPNAHSTHGSEISRLFASVESSDSGNAPVTPPVPGHQAPRVRWRRMILLGTLGVFFAILGWLPGHEDFTATASASSAPAPVGAPVPRISTMRDVPNPSRIDEWVVRFSTDHRHFVEEDLSRGTSYSWLIHQELVRQGLPSDLLVLPLIESQYLTRARSDAEAVGLWQFVAETARGYGLRVDEWVDERRDPVASTRSAVAYLAVLEKRFGSWPLVLAAYNVGPTRIARELASVGQGASLADIWDRLPRETREYVPKAVAAAIVVGDPERFGFVITAGAPYRFEEVWVPKGTSLALVAKSIDHDNALLRWLNPHLLRGMTPPDAWYPVRVPVGRALALVAAFGGLRPRTFLADE